MAESDTSCHAHVARAGPKERSSQGCGDTR
jgi:hypothetical protein